MIAVMLTPMSMSAFSSGVSQAGLGQVGPVQRARSQPSAQTPPVTMMVLSQTGPLTGGPPPDQKLPRGSLLDLSV